MLPMLVKFEGETRDNYLDLKLYAEMPGILAKCVAALKRLLERKSFSVPRRCKNLWLKYKTENDSVAQWIEDEPVVFKDKEKICELSSVKKMYKDFCWASGLRQVGPSELYDRLSKAGFKKGRSGDKRFIHGIRDMTNPNAPEDDTPISFVDTKTPF
jgi:phage/plasmid-associated DNA primase